jgi:hypothetical protein
MGETAMKYSILIALIASVSPLAYSQHAEAQFAGQTLEARDTTVQAMGARKAQNSIAQLKWTPDEAEVTQQSVNGVNVILQQVLLNPVSFTLPPPSVDPVYGCPLVNYTVTGKGSERQTTIVTKHGRDKFSYSFVGIKNGTAVDTHGYHYIFLYTNTTNIDSTSGIPNPTPPYDFYAPDVFQLIPVDGGIGYTINIYIKGRINSDGSFTDLGTIFDNNPNCDPI